MKDKKRLFSVTLTEKEMENIRGLIDFRYELLDHNAKTVSDLEEVQSELDELTALEHKLKNVVSPPLKIYSKPRKLSEFEKIIMKALSK